jgi:hypothetical protein
MGVFRSCVGFVVGVVSVGDVGVVGWTEGMVGNVLVVMLGVSGMSSECTGFVLRRDYECRMMRG